MRIGSVRKTTLVGIAALMCLAPAAAQQIFFPDFSTSTPSNTQNLMNLVLNGSHLACWNCTYSATNVLRLTDGNPGYGSVSPQATTAFFSIPQPVTSGFTSYFRFQIHTAKATSGGPPGDGLAFVIQNASTVDTLWCATSLNVTQCASGFGTTARGIFSGGLGYTGIPDSLAVEFDTQKDGWDQNANHVAVQGCGTNTNGPVHISGSFTVGSKSGVTSCQVYPIASTGYTSGNTANPSQIPVPTLPNLGVTNCGTGGCTDGVPHDVVIEYTPPTTPSGNGTLAVWVDPAFYPTTHIPLSTSKPVIYVPYNIDATHNPATGLSLAPDSSENPTFAYVGFSGSQTTVMQAQDILAWEFTPHTTTTVQQPIPTDGSPSIFPAGGFKTAVVYTNGVSGDWTPQLNTSPYYMTVKQTLVTRSDFYVNRLLKQKLPVPAEFKDEQCIVYGGTGGRCVVFSITCQIKQTDGSFVDATCPGSSAGKCLNPSSRVFDPTCIQFSTSFYTTDRVTPTNADYLKTDPIGSNNWVSDFLYYLPAVLDSRGGIQAGTPSDFVTTYKPRVP